MKALKLVAAAFAALVGSAALGQPQSPRADLDPHTARPDRKVREFVYLGQDELKENRKILDRPDIAGAEVLYIWKNLEPEKDRYDFSMIEHDLALVKGRGKALYIEVLDRFFQPNARHIPKYMLEDSKYGGGLVPQVEPGMSGWVTRQWDPVVRQRFQKLISALARQFDGRIAGLILPETALGLPKELPKGFTCDGYFEATKENALAARRAFKQSHVVQYVNFWPCEFANARGYMSRFFDFASANRIGVGGPDIVPWSKGQMVSSYAFIRVYQDKVPVVAMAVQEPTLEYINPATGKPFTRQEFLRFAMVYLSVDDLFWSKDSPWLKESPAASEAAGRRRTH
jgi:hypothetical protein